MKRLTKSQIVQIKRFSKNGLSLRKIRNKLNLPLSTIQYHVSKGSNRTRIKQIQLPSSDFVKGELVGAFAGDGSYYYDTNGRRRGHRITYYLSYKDDKPYTKYLSTKLKNLGLSVNSYIQKLDGNPSCIHLWINSIEYFRFIRNYLCWEKPKTYSVRLKKDIFPPKNFLFGFARGLMDTDGYVESHGIGCSSTSKELIYDLKYIFEIIGINPTIKKLKKKGNRRIQHRVRVKKSDLVKYHEEIGFSNPRKEKALLERMEKLRNLT